MERALAAAAERAHAAREREAVKRRSAASRESGPLFELFMNAAELHANAAAVQERAVSQFLWLRSRGFAHRGDARAR